MIWVKQSRQDSQHRCRLPMIYDDVPPGPDGVPGDIWVCDHELCQKVWIIRLDNFGSEVPLWVRKTWRAGHWVKKARRLRQRQKEAALEAALRVLPDRTRIAEAPETNRHSVLVCKYCNIPLAQADTTMCSQGIRNHEWTEIIA